MRKILPASLPHCVVVVTRWNNKCGISLKLQLNLHKSDAILKGHSYSGQFGPPLATSGRVLFFPGASAGKRGHQVPWGFHTCSESGWSWDSSEKPQRMDKQITLPTKIKTNNPRGGGGRWPWAHSSQTNPQNGILYIWKDAVCLIITGAPIFKNPMAKGGMCSHRLGKDVGNKPSNVLGQSMGDMSTAITVLNYIYFYSAFLPLELYTICRYTFKDIFCGIIYWEKTGNNLSINWGLIKKL